jgi:hypothetical protein
MPNGQESARSGPGDNGSLEITRGCALVRGMAYAKYLKSKRSPKTEIIPMGREGKSEMWIVHEKNGKEEWFCYEDKPGRWICVLITKKTK